MSAATSDTTERPPWLLGVLAGAGLLQAGIGALAGSYWVLDDAARSTHPLADRLASSGGVGQLLGIAGLSAMLVTALWSVRKLLGRWAWAPAARPFLTLHIVAGMLAPLFVLEHAGFRFGGLPGVAAIGLLLVTASGIVGRWLYGRLPARAEQERGQAWFSADLLRRASVGMDPQRPDRPSAAVDEAVQTLLDVPVSSVNALALVGREAALRQAWRQIEGVLDDAPGPGRVRLAIAAELASAHRARLRFHRLEAARRLLRWWHIAHVALGHAVLVLAGLHAFVALQYSGTFERIRALLGG